MISHVVLLKPRTDLTDAERRVFIDAFEQAVRRIPTVRGVRLGRRVRIGARYEQTTPDAADFLGMIDFDDADGLQTYLRHPAHVELGARFGQVVSSGMVYDFEIGGIESLTRWLVP
ncbi:MAG TPA: Dabb family protein [Vicinamibacterales bacterium]|nr:Dabb family protein [Vicinamibacterales bacterium]